MQINTIAELNSIDLLGLIKKTFSDAQAKKLLSFVHSDSELVTENGKTYELKIVRGLSSRPINRPNAPKGSSASEKTKEQVANDNPFTKPEPELTVCDNLLGTHKLILNKFPNSPWHFLMVTKEFVFQDTPLSDTELLLMWSMVNNISLNGEVFFAFFNSGPESGYSQYHKHMQFMKVPEEFKPLAEQFIEDANPPEGVIVEDPKASFKQFIVRIPSDVEMSQFLKQTYALLMGRVRSCFSDETVSYNILIMPKWIMVVPRKLANIEGIWCNSLAFLGLFSVKDEDVKSKVVSKGFDNILRQVSFDR